MKKRFMMYASRSVLMTLFFFVVVLLGSVALPWMAWAHSNGITGYSGNPATNTGQICTKCHSGGTVPTVTLTGPTSLAPGASGVYTFTITGGAAVVGGLDVSTTSGTLQATDPNTQLSGVEITHTSATHSFTSGSLAFTFTLVAPTSGTVTLYAAGLSADGDGTFNGDNAAGTTLAVTVTAPAPQIVVTDPVAPTTDHLIPFGSLLSGLTSDQTVTISNAGSANLVVGTIASVNPLAAPFTIQTDNCSGKTIAPGGICTFIVRFAPTAAGSFSDTFDIPSNDTATGTVTMSVTGTGTTAPVIAVTDSVAPTTDHQIPFGTITDGNTSDQTVTISNTGNASLSVGTIASVNPLAPPFTIATDNCSGKSIAPGGSCTLTVRFAPVTVNSFNDTFDIPSNDTTTGTVTMSVSGTGVTTPVPVIAVTDSVAPNNDLSIPFGSVVHNLTSDQTVTISNTGNANLSVGTITSPAAPFSITTNNCSGKTILPGGSCTLTVQFAPVTTGTFNSSFTIPSNDTATGTVTMNVSGTGGNNPPTPPTLVSPADGATGVGTTTTLTWEKSTDPNGDTLTYHLYNCPGDPSASCTPVDVASSGMTGIYFAGSGLLFFGFIMTRNGRGKKFMLALMMAMLLTTGVFVTSCGNKVEVTPTPAPSTNMTYQATGLSSGMTYYWKVVADDKQGGLVSSQTWSFTP